MESFEGFFDGLKLRVVGLAGFLVTLASFAGAAATW
jgi:hypothetical protein